MAFFFNRKNKIDRIPFALIKIDSIPLGAPGGGRASRHRRWCEVRTRSLKALGQVDIMSVMSSEVREGFWQAGCRSLQPACQKATADNGPLSAVLHFATCPKALSGRGQPTPGHAGHKPGGRGIKSDRIPFSGRWVGIKIKTRPPPQAAEDPTGHQGPQPEEADAPLHDYAIALSSASRI